MPATLVPRVRIEELEYFVSLGWGGGDGVIRGNGDAGAVVAQSPLSMKANVGTFRGFIANRLVRNASTTATADIVAPSGGSAGDLRRIDLVQYTLSSGVNIKQGVEQAGPVAPSADANSLVLAHSYCRKGMVSVKDADDASNGYIVDARTYV